MVATRILHRLARRVPHYLIVASALTCMVCAQEPPVARTPVMGWSSWNHFTCRVNGAIFRAQADALIATGMSKLGYQHVIVDDCWQGERDSRGRIHPNSKFPDMRGLAGYVHSKRMKFGIYSSPGPKTLAGFEGSFGHETKDAQTYAEWGVDWLKYDLCSFQGDRDAQIAAYRRMHEALQKTDREIVYAFSSMGRTACGHGVPRWEVTSGGPPVT